MLILALYMRLSMPVSVGVDCDDPHAYTCQVSAGGGWTSVARELLHITRDNGIVRSITVRRAAMTRSVSRYSAGEFSKAQCGLPFMNFDACD